MSMLAASMAGAAWLALFWPGVVTYDGVDQYRQALAGAYQDWHPPVMAALWRRLIRAGLAGSGPLFALQTALFFAGLGLFAGALARAGRRGTAAAALVCALLPPVASWLTAVIKDTQMVAALTAATGLVAWYRLPGGRVPRSAAVLAAVLLGYALLVRANAAFGAVPLALALVGWGGLRRPAARVGAAVAGIALVLALSGPINHRLFGATRSHVERTLPLFDLVGIAHAARLPTLPHLPAADWAKAETKGCYTPVYWDPFGDDARCGAIGQALAFDRDPDLPPIQRDWLGAIAAHPLAYAEHRLRHAVSTLRVLPPPRQAPAAAPQDSQPNEWHVGEPHRAATRWLGPVAVAVGASPVGAPAWWLLGALALLTPLRRTPVQPGRELALGLIWSALGTEAGLLAIGIASDLRYHLWTLLATALAACLLAASEGAPRGWGRRTALILGAGALAISVLRIAAPADWMLAG